MIVDRIEHWRRYQGGDAWETACTYLEGLDATAEVCDHHPLSEEDVFARVLSYPTRSREEAVVEAHEEYIDIQLSLVSSEGIDCFQRSGLAEETRYNAANDVTYFRKGVLPVARVINVPGQFTVLFPEDAHMPQLIVGDASRMVKKVVVKLRASLWGK